MKLWKQMSVFAHYSCFVPSDSLITSEMTWLTITENISKISIRLFWKASSAFAELFYNTQCQLKLLSAFEFRAGLVADVIFAQDQIIYYLQKKTLKKWKSTECLEMGLLNPEQIHMLELGNAIWNSSKKHYQKKSYWSNLEYVWRCAADAKVEMMYAVFIKQQIRYSTCGHWELKRKEVTLSRDEN